MVSRTEREELKNSETETGRESWRKKKIARGNMAERGRKEKTGIEREELKRRHREPEVGREMDKKQGKKKEEL